MKCLHSVIALGSSIAVVGCAAGHAPTPRQCAWMGAGLGAVGGAAGGAEAVELPELRFASGQAVIRLDSVATLAEAAKRLSTCSDERVRVEGHTDSTGPAALNQRLSGERAEALRQYLIESGIDAARIDAAGLAVRSR